MNDYTQTREMPRYKCHKEVWALKIKEIIYHAHEDPSVSIAEFASTDEFQGGHIMPEDDGYGPVPFDAAYYHKHKPEAGGYYVQYEDGYKSYSPAEPFEAGYSRI